MNPFQELIIEIAKNELTRSQSFDLSDSSRSSSMSSHAQNITSVSNTIGYNPARMNEFLGHHKFIDKNILKQLETIYENMPSSKQNQITTNDKRKLYDF